MSDGRGQTTQQRMVSLWEDGSAVELDSTGGPWTHDRALPRTFRADRADYDYCAFGFDSRVMAFLYSDLAPVGY